MNHEHILNEIRSSAIKISPDKTDYSHLLEIIGDAHYVLIGEATHGTEEFYRMRAELTRKLIEEKDFDAVAVEGDWPDVFRINRYVRGDEKIGDAVDALSEFKRFPNWMWRNESVENFIIWLHDHNQRKEKKERHGFYGLDLYSLNSSIAAVIEYLKKTDPKAAEAAHENYNCFTHHYGENPQEYGFAAMLGITKGCEEEAIRQLTTMRHIRSEGGFDGEELFSAEQNAKLVVDAERYYRSMFQSNVSSWNLRDQHMMDTFEAIKEHIEKSKNKKAKIVIWAHNSHIGDASATEMGQKNEWNIGQLIRNKYGDKARLIGFSTYNGTVTAASSWDGATELKIVKPAMRESYEALFHETNLENFILPLHQNRKLEKYLNLSRLQRAIGVLYLPNTEYQSHYFFTELPKQFDCIIHLDETHAVKPLD